MTSVQRSVLAAAAGACEGSSGSRQEAGLGRTEPCEKLLTELDLGRLEEDEDLADLVVQAEAVYAEHFDNRGFLENLRGWQETGRAVVAFLVLEGGEDAASRDLVGFAVYGRDGPSRTMCVLRVAVSGKFQRLGYGRRLLALAEDAALELSHGECKEVILHALRQAVPFYERLGYLRIPKEELPEGELVWMRRPCSHTFKDLEDWDVEVLSGSAERLEEDDELADLVEQAEVLHAEQFENCGFLERIREWKGCRVALLVVHLWDSALPPQLAGFVVYKRVGSAWFTSMSLLRVSVASRYQHLGFGQKLVTLVQNEVSQLAGSGEITTLAPLESVAFLERLNFRKVNCKSRSFILQPGLTLMRQALHTDHWRKSSNSTKADPQSAKEDEDEDEETDQATDESTQEESDEESEEEIVEETDQEKDEDEDEGK